MKPLDFHYPIGFLRGSDFQWGMENPMGYWNSNYEYAPLVADLSRNYTVSHLSVEVSVRGQVTKDNRKRIKAFVLGCCVTPGKLAKKVIAKGSKAALLSSYSICSGRKEPSWMSPLPLLIS